MPGLTSCSCQARNGQFDFYKELLGFLFLDALRLKTAIKYPLKSHSLLSESWLLNAAYLQPETLPSLETVLLAWFPVPASIICWIFSSGTFNDPSEQTVYAEWSPSESIWASLSLLLFDGALSSQFLTECVNFILPAARTKLSSHSLKCWWALPLTVKATG